MKMKRIISTLLAVVMLMSALCLVVGAEGEAEVKEYTYNTNSSTSLMQKNPEAETNPSADQYLYKSGKYQLPDGTKGTIETAQDKLATMDYRYGNDKYELYIDAYSGEIALVEKATGQILFSNPYDIGKYNDQQLAPQIKEELLSQIVVHYTEISTDTSSEYHSYTWAANRGQIAVKQIKGGIRVEYTIGRVESRSLLPRMIEKTAMEELLATIQANLDEAIATGKIAEKDVADAKHSYDQFKAYYYLIDPNDPTIVESVRQSYLTSYPIVEKCAIYVLDDSKIGDNTIKKLENMIKTYHPEYTFEDLDAAHAYVEYEGKTETTPLFKLALEYSLDDNGLIVKLPANGIRFNESLYRLDSIEILPYMGAGENPNPGYTFFPDGSGTLFDFQDIDILGTTQLVTGKVYGEDYAYHEISGMYEEVIRYPVFGIAETQTLERDIVAEDGTVTGTETYTQDRGFVAIVEEGDSLMELSSYHAGPESEYNTVKVSVYPRPTDTYNMADAISVGSNTDWTVVSSRKYTGNYQIRYMMLTDDTLAKNNNITDYYECSYVGMAKAYRKYLENLGVLTRLTEEDVKEDIPLYIETFCAMETTEKFLSIPFNVMTPLTSFQDIATMYDDLKAKEITNVNFVMTGYTKGGLTDPTVPYGIKWEKAVSKEMDFEELTQKAKTEGFGLFPDFDFVFASNDKLFDGLSLKKHAVKTIDNRYTAKREYSATKHTYVSYFELAISPAYFSHFYEKFIPKYQDKYSPTGISVSTLGSYLNSDFDEDEPYNRADGQQFTVDAFAYIREAFKDAEVMTSGGNAYTWKYVDHLKDVALDSSRFSISSAAVPFLGIVLHGYVEFAGTPINMEGNLDYAFLKALESGAALNFILSYRNTENLKEYETLSHYYSVRYDIWFDDMVSMYLELNELLKGVQTSTIVHHEFISGVRVPDDDELIADAAQAVKDKIAAEAAEKQAAEEAVRESIMKATDLLLNGTVELKNAADDMDATVQALKAEYTELQSLIQTAKDKIEAFRVAQKTHVDNKAAGGDDTVTRPPRDAALTAANESMTAVEAQLKVVYEEATRLQDLSADYDMLYKDIRTAITVLKHNNAYEAEYRNFLIARGNDAALQTAWEKLLNATTGLAVEAAKVAADAYTAADAFSTHVDDVRTILNTAEYENHQKMNTYTAAEYSYQSAPVAGAFSGGSGYKPDSVSNEIPARYVSDDNMIVYEVYENGTALLLNFNDFRVVVTIGEISYTIDAYGYVVLSRGA